MLSIIMARAPNICLLSISLAAGFKDPGLPPSFSSDFGSQVGEASKWAKFPSSGVVVESGLLRSRYHPRLIDHVRPNSKLSD